MKIIFKCNGSDLLADQNATFCPQIGWMPTILNQQFLVIGVSPDYDSKEEIIIVNVELATDSLIGKSKSVTVQKVWNQSKDSLTLNKTYEVLRETLTHFTILDDSGREKKYKHGNFQFKY